MDIISYLKKMTCLIKNYAGLLILILFFCVPEYKNELGEVIGKYEIIKNEGLVDIP